MLGKILNDIQSRLMEKVPAIRYVDEDWGQLEYDQPPVQFPCALIDVDGFDFRQLGVLEQKGEGAIYVRIADMRLSNTSGQAPDNQKQQSAELHAILHDVFKALHGFTAGDYSAMIRQSIKRVRRTDTMREYLMTFATAYRERRDPPVTTIIEKLAIVAEIDG